MGKKEKAIRKVVLDTNVLISALLFKGRLAGIVDLWKKERIIPLFSRETFEEFKAVLEYPKFALKEEEIRLIIEEEVLPYFQIVVNTGKDRRICRDPDDDKFIVCAVSAPADFIVTGDKDLLELGRYRAVRIIDASTLLNMFSLTGK